MKNKLLKNKLFVTTAAMICALSISACGSNDNANENQDPMNNEGMTQTEEMTSETATENGTDNGEFDRILNESTESNDVIDYINTNIVDAGVEDVERFFTGLFNFGDNIRDIDFTRLNDSKQHMPEDVIAFMDLMQLEAETPSITMAEGENRNTINMTLSEMLDRALLFEQHIVRYPDNVSTEAAGRLYEEIATAAITGGYDKEQGVEHYYKGETADEIDREALQYYQQFAQAHPDSNLGIIVKEYIAVLEANDFKINETVEEYYKSLGQKLDINTWAKAGTAETETAATTETANDTNSTESDTVIEGTMTE